jgi:hypothetical protein
MWRRYPELHAEQVISVSGEGIERVLLSASVTTDWTYWTKVSRIRDAYVLETKHRGHVYLPLGAFASRGDEHQFLELVTRHTATRLDIPVQDSVDLAVRGHPEA